MSRVLQLTVTIRDSDEQTLNDLAATQWRNAEQQASALIEQALRAQRSRNESATERRPRGRKPSTAA